MSVFYEGKQQERLIKKPVKDFKVLHSLDNLNGIEILQESKKGRTIGTAQVSDEVLFEGQKNLKIKYTNEVKEPDIFECVRLRLNFDKADWSNYNRLSFWIYPKSDALNFYSACVEFKNGGEHPFPDRNWLCGIHNYTVEPNKWNQIVWEFSELPRDCVSFFQFNFTVPGRQPNMPEFGEVYIAELKLETVETDKPKGWDMDKNRIAFCHSGYAPADKKIAVSSKETAEEFKVVDAKTNKVVFSAKQNLVLNHDNEYSVLDFTALNTCGEYKILFAGKETPSFKIEEQNLLHIADKLRNFFYCERCGYELEGVHGVCHTNMYVVHPKTGEKLSVSGGWHDAGDLSQGLCNTAEAANSFYDAAESVKTLDADLADRLIKEGRHGTEWLLKTRFGDGYRSVWNTARNWTDDLTGEEDYCNSQALNNHFENFCSVASEAAAYKAFKDSDKAFAEKCLDAAKVDFEVSLKEMNNRDLMEENELNFVVEAMGECALAALSLYEISGEEKYLEIAAQKIEYIMSCQQVEMPDWEKPIRGFFYENADRKTPVVHEHRGHDQAITMPIAKAIMLAPNHKDFAKWQNCLKLYKEYILSLEEFAKPYGYLPTAIYFSENRPCIHKDGAATGKKGKPRLSEEEAIKYYKNGIKLGDGVYLRYFPIWESFRGNFGVMLSRAKSISAAAKALNDQELLEIAKRQMNWVLGNNPFSRSFMYGEGYDNPNLYTSFSPDMVGEIPVGINCHGYEDAPYAPVTTQATYYEVWVHPVSRMLWTLSDIL